ncbi:MAG: transposase [Tepidisphaeraceae bacterium]
MDQAQWATLVAVLRAVARSLPRTRRCVYSDFLIARLYFWAVLHDWPMTWATDLLHYNRLFRPRKLPSLSQLNRRIAGERFRLLLSRVHERLGRPAEAAGVLCLDGKPLPVSPVSGDRDARCGHVGRGYKLHAVVTATRTVPVFSVLPMNRHEMPVARLMLRQTPITPGTLVLADGNYDAHVLHKDVHARGGFLVTRPRTGGARQRQGRGHPVTRRQMGPARRHLIDLWDAAPQTMRRLYQKRVTIERLFGHLSCTPGLLGPLPGFVRGLTRVRRWVGAKICLYHARRQAKINLNMKA